MSMNVLLKFTLIVSMIFLSLSAIHAAAPLLNITMTESATEELRYNPLGNTNGIYAESGENYTSYTITGQINVTNVHATVSAQDILINLTNVTNVYGLTNSTSPNGYVTLVGANDAYLYIPDLGAGQSAIFNYTVNTSNVAPPLNLSVTYESGSRVFSGQPVTVNESLTNALSAGLYPDTCIYNVSVRFDAATINDSGIYRNVTFGGTSLTGSDVTNASITDPLFNRTIQWNVSNFNCITAGSSLDISYNAIMPNNMDIAGFYPLVNSTTSYLFNNTFSTLRLGKVQALVDLDVEFEKRLNGTTTGENGTWLVWATATNPTDVDVNLTTVSLWVSVRNATTTGFTNPNTTDVDSVSGGALTRTYSPGVRINDTSAPWNNTGSEWFFNYSFLQSPIVWMDIDGVVFDDGIQLVNRTISRGESNILTREIYVATGYWLEISRNITRLDDNRFNVFIYVRNLGSSPTPSGQVVQVYNFIPITFTMNSSFVFSDRATSPFYNTSNASEILTDPIYNGTMHQYAIIENNNRDVSLDNYLGISNENNSWSVVYNVTGSGQFAYDDLFLTGVDPLNVEKIGGTQAVSVDGVYSFIGARVEYVLGAVAAVLGIVTLIM